MGQVLSACLDILSVEMQTSKEASASLSVFLVVLLVLDNLEREVEKGSVIGAGSKMTGNIDGQM